MNGMVRLRVSRVGVWMECSLPSLNLNTHQTTRNLYLADRQMEFREHPLASILLLAQENCKIVLST